MGLAPGTDVYKDSYTIGSIWIDCYSLLRCLAVETLLDFSM
jgi:hypothetical protein